MRKDITDFPGYCVDDSGVVISKSRKIFRSDGRSYIVDERVLKPTYAGRGYQMICLRKDGKSYHQYVHRLVALLFVQNPENKSVVNHIDGNKDNNNASNLEWCDYSENNQHAYDTGLRKRGSDHYISKLTEEDVRIIKHKYFIDGYSRPEIYKMFPYVCRGSIHCILKNKSWKHITDY